MDPQQQQHLEELRLAHQKRLHMLELQAALKGNDVLADIRIEIGELHETINKIDVQLFGSKKPSPPTKNTDDVQTVVEILLRGDFDKWTPEVQYIARRTLAAIMEISPDQITFLRVTRGSINIRMRVPIKAAKTLIALYEAKDPLIEELGIESARIVENKAASKENIAQLRALIDEHKRRLHHLEVQAARYGSTCPPHILIDIEDAKENTEHLERQLNSNLIRSHAEGRNVLYKLGSDISNIERGLERAVIKEERTYRLFGVRILSITRTVAQLLTILFIFITLAAVLLTGRALIVANNPTPVPTPLVETPSIPTSVSTSCSLVSARPPISKPATELKAEILSPQPCSTDLSAGASFPVGGTYSGNLAGQEIWILIYPSDHKYYPQTPNACEALPAQASEGRWAAPIGLGGPPQQYDIVVTVTNVDSETSQVFKRWLEAGCSSKSFPGFSKLPTGLTELKAITVRTK